MGFDFAVIAPLLLSHCGFSFVFGCGVSFLVSSSVLLSMIVQQLVVILVFSQEGVRVHPSTLPSWFRLPRIQIFGKICIKLRSDGSPGDWALRIEGFQFLMCIIKNFFLYNLQLEANLFLN